MILDLCYTIYSQCLHVQGIDLYIQYLNECDWMLYCIYEQINSISPCSPIKTFLSFSIWCLELLRGMVPPVCLWFDFTWKMMEVTLSYNNYRQNHIILTSYASIRRHIGIGSTHMMSLWCSYDVQMISCAMITMFVFLFCLFYFSVLLLSCCWFLYHMM